MYVYVRMYVYGCAQLFVNDKIQFNINIAIKEQVVSKRSNLTNERDKCPKTIKQTSKTSNIKYYAPMLTQSGNEYASVAAALIAL